jgi:hypothetical protein
MCVGREMFNLCKCGCTEAEHKEELDVLTLALAHSGLEWKRGKCHGRRLLPFGQTYVGPMFEDCTCAAFDPVFKNLCEGF